MNLSTETLFEAKRALTQRTFDIEERIEKTKRELEGDTTHLDPADVRLASADLNYLYKRRAAIVKAYFEVTHYLSEAVEPDTEETR